MLRPRSISAALLLSTGAALIALAQPTQPASRPTSAPATLPTAVEMIGRYVEATGGRDAYAAIKSRRSVGTFAMADLGIEGTITTLIRADGKAVSTTELPGQGIRRRGVNDGVAWEVDFAGVARIFTGDAAKAVARSLSLTPLATLDGYTDAKIADIVDLNGRPTYRMLMTSDAGVAEMRFYDVESSLLAKVVIQMTGPGGEPLVVTTNFSDYEDAPPIRLPTKTQQMMTGMSPEAAMTKVEHDVDLPDALFALPAEVAKLLPTTQASKPSS